MYYWRLYFLRKMISWHLTCRVGRFCFNLNWFVTVFTVSFFNLPVLSKMSALPVDFLWISLVTRDTSLCFCSHPPAGSSAHFSGNSERCYTRFLEAQPFAANSPVHRRSYLYKWQNGPGLNSALFTVWQRRGPHSILHLSPLLFSPSTMPNCFHENFRFHAKENSVLLCSCQIPISVFLLLLTKGS